jgi:hypothetical protein
MLELAPSPGGCGTSQFPAGLVNICLSCGFPGIGVAGPGSPDQHDIALLGDEAAAGEIIDERHRPRIAPAPLVPLRPA